MADTNSSVGACTNLTRSKSPSWSKSAATIHTALLDEYVPDGRAKIWVFVPKFDENAPP